MAHIFNRILLAKLAVILTCLVVSSISFATTVETGGILVHFKSQNHLSRSQLKTWVENCHQFANKFKAGEGFWNSGIATESACILNKKERRLLSKDKAKDYSKTLTKAKKELRFVLDIKIRGKASKRSKKEKNIAEKVIGETISFWEGLFSQLFQIESDEKRKITFTLRYRNKKSKNILVRKTFDYNEKFMGYFDIDGFSELLAWHLLVDAPFQWRANKIEPLEILDGLDNKKVSSISMSKSVTDIQINKNIFIVKTHLMGKRIFNSYGNPIAVDTHRKLMGDITKGELLTEFIVMDPMEKIEDKDIFLSIGYEPYTRYYTHKKFNYLLRKLEKLNLTFFFGGTGFGVSQLLVNNDEVSYVGFRYASAVSENTELLGTYYNVDLAINKGITKGLEGTFDYWPETSVDRDDVTITLQASRLQIGYKYSFLLPLTGAVDITPTVGLWNYEASGVSAIESDYIKNSSVPALGIGFGYSINLFDFIVSGFARYSTGFASTEDISSLELGADIGYELSNVYAMRTIDPAIYGFISNQSIAIRNKEETLLSEFQGNGLVIGVGISIVWE